LLKDSLVKELYQLYNIGKNSPVQLLDFIQEIEKATEKEAEKIMMPMQSGDVYQTYADSENLIKNYDYKPKTPINKGVKAFMNWYKMYYKKEYKF
jgi:UDP-glucuronate 4-epimerase